MTIGIWYLICLVVVTAVIDVWLYMEKTNRHDTITERIRQLPISIQLVLMLCIGIIVGHLWH